MSAMGHLHRLFVVLPALLLGPALALAEADGPDFYRLVDVAADDVLNIRAGPGAEHPIVGLIPANADGIANFGCVGGLNLDQWASATAEERSAAQGHRWCRVGYDRTVGWAAGRYLAEGAAPDAFNGGERLTSLAGSEWQLRHFAGEAVAGEAWIAFQVDGMVTGHSGCNRFNGRYAESPGRIEVELLAMTRIACPPPLMGIEATFSQALEAARGTIATHLVLALFDVDDLLLATLTRRDAD
jgi:heat shock protein HslJ